MIITKVENGKFHIYFNQRELGMLELYTKLLSNAEVPSVTALLEFHFQQQLDFVKETLHNPPKRITLRASWWEPFIEWLKS